MTNPPYYRPVSSSSPLNSHVPPPHYDAIMHQNGVGSAKSGSHKYKRQTFGWCLAMVLVAVAVFAVTTYYRDDSCGKRELERNRRQWQAEKELWMEQRRVWENEREELQKVRRGFEADKRQWAEAREKHEEDQRRWAQERAMQLRMLWNAPHAENHCTSYNTREYTAQLNGIATCKIAPIMIHNKTLVPTKCEQIGSGGDAIIQGSWTVDFDEPKCRPHWEFWNDKGCTYPGSGIYRMEAQLWENLRSYGDNWFRMCESTPADIDGRHFDGPTACEKWHGIFEWQDPRCLWEYDGEASDGNK